MTYLIAMLVGGILGMILLGEGLAWIVRKATGIGWTPSLIVALVILIPVAGWSYASNTPGASMLAADIMYTFCAAVAFAISYALQMRKGPTIINIPTEPSPMRAAIWRMIGWALFVLLLALGSTSLFSAYRSTYDAEFPFFIGAVCLAVCFLLWRKLAYQTTR